MSDALADFLIDLADPGQLERFKVTPEIMMDAANLTEVDKAALRSGRPGLIHREAKRNSSLPQELTEYTSMETDATAILNGQCAVLIIIIEIVHDITDSSSAPSRIRRRAFPSFAETGAELYSVPNNEIKDFICTS